MIRNPDVCFRIDSENPYPHFPLVAYKRVGMKVEVRRGPADEAVYVRYNSDGTVDSWFTQTHTPESLLNITDGKMSGRVARNWVLA